MNWKFILRWVLTFAVCLVVYDLTGSFWMSLGILILLAIAESYVIDLIEKRRSRRRDRSHCAALAVLTAGAALWPAAMQADEGRSEQYYPQGRAFVCENGQNRFTRALYGGYTDWRLETSDRPIFAVYKKGHCKSVRFVVNGVPIETAEYCRAIYQDGMRSYVLKDSRWTGLGHQLLRVHTVALHDEEGAIWQFVADKNSGPLRVKALVCDIRKPKLKRNGDLGVDDPTAFEPAEGDASLVASDASIIDNYGHVYLKGDKVEWLYDGDAFVKFNDAVAANRRMASRVQFDTPDPYINTLGGALVMAADGMWDGQTWLHGCIGWRAPLPGWRAAFAGDVLGWNDRARSHFEAYARSQVNQVAPQEGHPTQDPAANMARADKRWGTQIYSDGYICRTPGRNDQMHHYDMNLNYIDELLWHFQYDADPDFMRRMWPVIKAHLAWEKRCFDPDGDHLYDAYCCIWASDALYYNGGAVTHSSAYNYRANLVAARIAETLGEPAEPYRQEAEAILQAMNQRLWLPAKGHWAEYQDMMGLKRLHESAALWSIYTPIDCGACTPEQAYRATQYVDRYIPHITVDKAGHRTISTTDWQPYSWSVNNVAAAEVMHTALAYYYAGRPDEAFMLMKANIMDQMYCGQSPANFGQLSHYDAARGECYRDFGDCIGISARTLVQGLFGIVPDALNGQCIIRPGLPSEWNRASVRTPYLEYTFTRSNGTDRYEITQHFAQPLKIILRQNTGGGTWRDVEGTAETRQVISVETPANTGDTRMYEYELVTARPAGTGGAVGGGAFRTQNIDNVLNASVTDVFRQQYLSPRPQYTTLQIPVQGAGDWCSFDRTPQIDDSGLRSLVRQGEIRIEGVPFRTHKSGHNIAFTSLWDNWPTSIQLPLAGKASAVHLLMAGTTNHMQSHIDNGMVVVAYQDNTCDTLMLRNPDNWCPIERDYYDDGRAFRLPHPRPMRIALATGRVGRTLSEQTNPTQCDIPGGAAQMLTMPLRSKKKLKSLTVRTLSNDVVIGLMAVTLQ